MSLGLVAYAALLALAILVSRAPATAPWRVLRGILVLAVVAIPFAFARELRLLVQASALALVLGLELIAPGARIELTGAESVRNVTFIALRKLAMLLAGGSLLQLLNRDHAVSWGLSAQGAPLWLQAIVACVVLDFQKYWYHRGQHAFTLWWGFHKLHHAPRDLSVLASNRSHVLEYYVLNAGGTVLVSFLLGISLEAYVYGYVIPGLLLSDVFAHANLDCQVRRLRWLNRWIVTPNVHALHHTRHGDHRNFGQSFMVWDVLFGTFEEPAGRPLDFGVDDDAFTARGALAQHLIPLAAIPRAVARALAPPERRRA